MIHVFKIYWKGAVFKIYIFSNVLDWNFNENLLLFLEYNSEHLECNSAAFHNLPRYCHYLDVMQLFSIVGGKHFLLREEIHVIHLIDFNKRIKDQPSPRIEFQGNSYCKLTYIN